MEENSERWERSLSMRISGDNDSLAWTAETGLKATLVLDRYFVLCVTRFGCAVVACAWKDGVFFPRLFYMTNDLTPWRPGADRNSYVYLSSINLLTCSAKKHPNYPKTENISHDEPRTGSRTFLGSWERSLFFYGDVLQKGVCGIDCFGCRGLSLCVFRWVCREEVGSKSSLPLVYIMYVCISWFCQQDFEWIDR